MPDKSIFDLGSSLPTSFSNSSWDYPSADHPISLSDLTAAYMRAMEEFSATPRIPLGLIMNDSSVLTASGAVQMRECAQPGLEKIHSSIGNGIKIIVDKYCPLTVSRQYRFPRSKKKRIQKKWRNNRLNWREENVVFLFNPKGVPSTLKNFTF